MENIDFITGLIIGGLIGTTALLASAFISKLTGGLFFSRLPWRYQKDRQDPRFELERKIGLAYSHLVLKYVPPFFIGFLLLTLWLLLK